jgi:branched-chain amino acid transport system substrate-binding protein
LRQYNGRGSQVIYITAFEGGNKLKRSVRLVKRFVGCLMIGVMFAVAGCAGTSAGGSQSTTIKIGVSYPLSGSLADSGAHVKNAAQMAADIINGKYPDVKLPFAATEGIPNKGGAKIELVFADNQCSPEKGASEAERLINQEKVPLLYGGYCSSVTATASQVAERAGVPYVNDISSSPALPMRGFKWFFSVTPNDGDFAEMFFKFMDEMKTEGKKLDTVGIVWENSAFGTDAAKAEREFAQKYGYNVTIDMGYPAKTSNVSSEVQKLKSSKPDILLANSYVSDAVLYMKAMKDNNYAPPAILAQDSGYVDPQFIKILGKDAEYILSREVFAPDLAKVNPNAKVINDMFKAKYGVNLNANTARAFQGVFVVADVFNRAASTKPEDLRKALVATDIKADQLMMPWQGIKFNEHQRNPLGRGIIVQIQNGEYVTVWPKDVAAAKLVWPFPAWDKR